jgi:hypothetical protein
MQYISVEQGKMLSAPKSGMEIFIFLPNSSLLVPVLVLVCVNNSGTGKNAART